MFHKHLEINHQPQTLENTMSKEFKAGDFVYCPHIGTQIFALEDNDSVNYPLCFTYYNDGGYKVSITFTLDGMEAKEYKTPQIFHATPEMKAKLDDLYGVEFEKPPVKPTSKEIVKAYLDRGDKVVPCWVSNINGQPTSVNKWVFIEQVLDGDYPFFDKDDRYWIHATPFDHTTLQPITELPEGDKQ